MDLIYTAIMMLAVVLLMAIVGLLFVYRRYFVVLVERFSKPGGNELRLLAVFALVAAAIMLSFEREWPGPGVYSAWVIPQFLRQITTLVGGALICGGYSLACLAVGLRLLKFLGISAAPGNCGWASAFLLGLGCFGITWQYLAIFDVFKPVLLIGICALVLVTNLNLVRRDLIPATHWISGGFDGLRHLPIPHMFLAAIILLYFVPVFMMIPLQQLHIDALAYYAAQAKLIAHTGSYVPLGGTTGTYSGHMFMGMAMEMNYAFCYALACILHE